MVNFARFLVPCLLAAVIVSLGETAEARPAPAQNAAQPVGQRVAEVRVVSETGDVLEENPANLPLMTGQEFTLEAERESLRQLFRTGRYADLVTQVTPVQGGLRVDFDVQRNFFINAVTIMGLHEPPSEALALSSLRLMLGEVFRETEMPAALERLRQALENDGLYGTKLSYQLSANTETRQMNITVVVQPGPRARLGMLRLINQTPYTDVELRDKLKLNPGTQITSQKLDRAVERERKWLVTYGYLGARVTVVRGAYDAASNEVPLEIRASAGPNVRVQVEGANISSRTLRSLVPVYEEGAVDEDLLQEGRRNIRDYLQRAGYFDAEVTYTTSMGSPKRSPGGGADAPEAEVITYDVNRGRKRRLVGIAFAGNRYFNDEILRSRVRLQPAAFASPGRFSSQQLASDTASLVALYQSNGFRSAQVKSELVENYQGKMDELFVRFHIEEGAQTLVAELKLEGNKTLSEDDLLRVIGSTPGQPFSDFNVTGDRDNVLALYYDRGFPQAGFRANVEELPSNPGPRVRLTYQIQEGTQLRVAAVLLGGYEHTRRHVIEGQVQIKAGQPLSEGAVVETQRRLYNLGVFNRVSIAPQNPTGTDPNKTVAIVMEEARRYTVAYGLGFEAQRLGNASAGPTAQPLRFSPRATFEISKLNLTGHADILSFKIRASTQQGRALLGYTAANFLGHENWSLQLSGLGAKTRDVQTFTSTRSEGSLQLSDKITLATTLVYRYVYRRVVASNLNSTITPEEIPLFSQPTQVSFFSMTWLRDRRDNAADPTRGNFNSIDLDVAGKRIGSSASFVRSTFQNSTYTRLTRRLTLARSTRIAVEQPIAGSVSNEIPLPERFFAGGGTTLRGFGLNQAGPRDPATGFPVGGLAMLIFNQQLQFPMRLPLIGNRAGGAVFYDAGNVFTRFKSISLRPAPPAPVFDPASPTTCLANCSNDLNYFSHTLGFELRYHTPVGPVSIDLAYQLNAARFLIPTSTTGACASPVMCVKLARLPAFQFFVNLGTTF